MNPLILFTVMILFTALCHLVISKLLHGPRVGSMIISGTLATVLMPAVAFAGASSTGAATPLDLGTAAKLLGLLFAAVGGNAWLDHVKAKAKSWEDEVLAAAKREARSVGVMVQNKLVEGGQAVGRVLDRLDGWIAKQGKKLPAGPLRDKAIGAAHDVFQELHLYADQAAHEAVKQLGDAVSKFQDALPAIKRQIDSFPKGTLPLPATSGEVRS